MNVLVKLMYIIWEATSSLEHMNPLPLDISRVTRELPKKLQLCTHITLQGYSHKKPSYREFIKFGRHHDSNTPFLFSPGKGSRQPLHRPARCNPWGQHQSLWPLSPEDLRGEMEERKTQLVHTCIVAWVSCWVHSIHISTVSFPGSHCQYRSANNEKQCTGLGTWGYEGTLLSDCALKTCLQWITVSLSSSQHTCSSM